MATDSKNTQKYPKIPSKTPILGHFTLILANFYPNFVAKYFLKSGQKVGKVGRKWPFFTKILQKYYKNFFKKYKKVSVPTFVAKYFLKSGQKKYANLAQKEETMYITMPQLFYKIFLFIHKTCV